jgi:uncharacterized membrane protein YcaP (DUF421 family)
VDAVLRAAAIYVFLMLVFRLSGRRTLSEMSTFDFVLLLIISESTQQAMLDDDHSMTNAFLVIVTLVLLDIGLSLVKARSPRAEKWLDGLPTILVEEGRPLPDVMERARVDEADVLESARKHQGLERMDQIKYAILERNGGISIVPMPGARS